MFREWHGTGPEDQEQLRKMNDVLEKFLVDSQDCDSVTEDCLDISRVESLQTCFLGLGNLILLLVAKNCWE